MHERVIRAGRIVCPRTGLDGPGAVAIDGCRIAAVGENLEGAKRIELPDAILLPGLIDLHAHPGCSGMVFHGVEPDEHMLSQGVTTVLSQGDAGAGNFSAYLEDTIRPSRTRVLMALNLSRKGVLALGAFANPDDADIVACVDTDPRLIARRGVEAAERSGPTAAK